MWFVIYLTLIYNMIDFVVTLCDCAFVIISCVYPPSSFVHSLMYIMYLHTFILVS